MAGEGPAAEAPAAAGSLHEVHVRAGSSVAQPAPPSKPSSAVEAVRVKAEGLERAASIKAAGAVAAADRSAAAVERSAVATLAAALMKAIGLIAAAVVLSDVVVHPGCPREWHKRWQVRHRCRDGEG